MWLQSASEEKSFEIVDGRRTDDRQRTTEPAHTISSPGAFGSGELTKRDHNKQKGGIFYPLKYVLVAELTEHDQAVNSSCRINDYIKVLDISYQSNALMRYQRSTESELQLQRYGQ